MNYPRAEGNEPPSDSIVAIRATREMRMERPQRTRRKNQPLLFQSSYNASSPKSSALRRRIFSCRRRQTDDVAHDVDAWIDFLVDADLL